MSAGKRRLAIFGVLAMAGLVIPMAPPAGAGLKAQSLPPYISSLDPATGTPGTNVTIGGMNFTGVSRVVFSEGRAANFKVNSDTEILATVPQGTISGPISVETPVGTAKSQMPFEVPIQ
jgi:hypothetical protein